MGKKIKDVAIDADHILYNLASPPPASRKGTLKGKSVAKVSHSIKKLKKAFLDVVSEYTKIAEVESIAYKWTIGETIVVISDVTNFRYELYPAYKANRIGREQTREFVKLRKWARKKFAPKQNIEADDKVAYLVRKGAIGFTADKDLLYGVDGIWFDTYHTRYHWVRTSKEEANRFNMLQCVMGDLGDNIRGIEGVGKVTATKLLDKHGWSWDGVLQSYYEKGLTKEDAILTKRLVSLDQWSPKKGLQLFKR